MDSSCMNTHVSSNMLAKTKASLIERRKSENVGAKSWKAELRLKKELMSPQKPRSCPTTLHYRAFGDFPETQNSCRRTNLNSSFRIFCSLKKVLLVYHDHYWMTKHGRGEGSILVSWSLLDDGTWEEKEMVQKENNILIDETRTDLRQGFQGIHQSSSFVPHLVSCSQSLSQLTLLIIQFLAPLSFVIQNFSIFTLMISLDEHLFLSFCS